MADEQDEGREGAPTPPAPRPDPYTQFGNPLNDTWGTQKPPPQPTYTTVEPVRPKGRSNALKWVVALVVVAMLGVGIWLAREPLGDAWDSATDAVSGGSDDEEPFDAAAQAQTEEFEAWMDENEDALQLLGQDTLVAAAEMVEFSETATLSADVDPVALRSALVSMRASSLATVQFLDDAPQSPVRDDFVGVLLVSVEGISAMIEALDGRSADGMIAAGDELTKAGEEIERLCRQYGSSAAGLC